MKKQPTRRLDRARSVMTAEIAGTRTTPGTSLSIVTRCHMISTRSIGLLVDREPEDWAR